MDLTKITKEQWENDLYPRLLAYARYWLNQFSWFRQTDDETFVRGNQPHDYVMRAVKYHLDHPDKFDPKKRTFLSYLKNHVLKHMIRDDAESKENRTTTDNPSGEMAAATGKTDDDVEDSPDWHELLPAANHFFDGEMDISLILQEIRDALAPDPDALAIFEGISTGFTRAEVMEMQGWTEGHYTNAWKRMERHRSRITGKYHLKVRNLKK